MNSIKFDLTSPENLFRDMHPMKGLGESGCIFKEPGVSIELNGVPYIDVSPTAVRDDYCYSINTVLGMNR